MQLTVDRSGFAAVLGLAAKHVLARSPIPLLSTVLVRASGGQVEIVATDLDRLYRATIEARVETEGTTAANASLLAGFVRSAAGTEVGLALDGSLLVMRSGQACGRIPTLAASDFPEPFQQPPRLSFDLDATDLAACLGSVRYAISNKKARYYLNGISWSIKDGRLELCATDGHVLSTTSREMPVGAEKLQPLIVPDLALPAFNRSMRIDVADSYIRFSGDAGEDCSVAVTSKLIDGRFPDYRRIIKPASATATVERKALADAVGRCMPLCEAAKTHAPIDLVHDTAGELVVRVNAADGAEIEDRIGIEGSQFAVSLSGHMLAATLASFDGNTIEIGLTGIGDNVRFGEPGEDHRLAIVMPVRGTLTHRIGPPVTQAA